jgi:hypothetical protein
MADNAAASVGPMIRIPVAQLGIVELQEVQRWLGLSHPVVTRIMREAGIPFFRLGKKKCCRVLDLEPWLRSMALEGYLEADTCSDNASQGPAT